MLTNNLAGRQSENDTSGSIKRSNYPSRARGNNTVGDGSKDIGHVLLVFLNLFYHFVQISKETSIFNGNSCLITEGQQQVTVSGFKHCCGKLTVNIDCANAAIT